MAQCQHPNGEQLLSPRPSNPGCSSLNWRRLAGFAGYWVTGGDAALGIGWTPWTG